MIEIAQVTPGPGLDACIAIRRTVFVGEQNVAEEEEMDGLDPECLHVLASDQGRPAGTLRLRELGDTMKIQRVAVLPEWRGTGLGAQLMRFALDLARSRGLRHARLGAQTQALGFYEKLGFSAEGPEFLDAGIPHREMTRDL